MTITGVAKHPQKIPSQRLPPPGCASLCLPLPPSASSCNASVIWKFINRKWLDEHRKLHWLAALYTVDSQTMLMRRCIAKKKKKSQRSPSGHSLMMLMQLNKLHDAPVSGKWITTLGQQRCQTHSSRLGKYSSGLIKIAKQFCLSQSLRNCWANQVFVLESPDYFGARCCLSPIGDTMRRLNTLFLQ